MDSNSEPAPRGTSDVGIGSNFILSSELDYSCFHIGIGKKGVRFHRTTHCRNHCTIFPSEPKTSNRIDLGYNLHVLSRRAVHLGLSFSRRRPWTQEEAALLESLAGRYSPASLARKLGRTFASIKAKLKQLEISARVSEGYSQADLQELLGASRTSIRRWCRMGWLPVVNGRIPERAVARFLRSHPHEYQLRRVDEAWFKGLLFPSFNSADGISHAIRTSSGSVPASMPTLDGARNH